MLPGVVSLPRCLRRQVTPAAVHAAIRQRAFLRAFLLALRLNDPQLLRHVLLSTPPQQVRQCARRNEKRSPPGSCSPALPHSGCCGRQILSNTA